MKGCVMLLLLLLWLVWLGVTMLETLSAEAFGHEANWIFAAGVVIPVMAVSAWAMTLRLRTALEALKAGRRWFRTFVLAFVWDGFLFLLPIVTIGWTLLTPT